MSPEPKNVSVEILEESIGSLRSCLVEGDTEQRRGARRVRRRALAISILLQIAVLATLFLVPLFGKAERITLTIVTPIPPYSAYRDVSQHSNAPHPPPHRQLCRVCAPPSIPPTIVTHDNSSVDRNVDESLTEGLEVNIPGATNELIPVSDPRQRGPEIPQVERRNEPPRVLHITHLDPGMLQHRVEPVYPTLAIQIRREGRVELRATIGTDGSIQSVQVVAGDPLFLQSALQAVQQWHYKPTYLNGQAMEVDTYITVVYTLQH
jgi:TonB family protein